MSDRRISGDPSVERHNRGTHSNGIGTLNAFLGALSGRRRIRNAFAIDPARAQ